MLQEHIRNQIRRAGRELGATKIVLFGSRARNDERERSDIDIAVFGLQEDKRSAFISAIDNIGTLLAFDIVFVADNTSPALLENIDKDGVMIMDKTNEKRAKFSDALKRLDEAIDDYGTYGLDSIRDGVIQRFEFCVELAWKVTREYLLDQGYTDVNSPKLVMKTAFADHLIDAEDVWIDILNSRNITSHIYDRETSEQVFTKIASVYRPAFHSLEENLQIRL